MATNAEIDHVADWLDHLTINNTLLHLQQDDPLRTEDIEIEHDWTTWFWEETCASTKPATSTSCRPSPLQASIIHVPRKQCQHRVGFFDLPPELRSHVYSYAVIPRWYCYKPLLLRSLECFCCMCGFKRYRKRCRGGVTLHSRFANHCLHADKKFIDPLEMLNKVSTVCKLFTFECRAVFFKTWIHVMEGDYTPIRSSKRRLHYADFPKLQCFVRHMGLEARTTRHIRIENRDVAKEDVPTSDQIERALAYCEGLDHPKLRLEITFGQDGLGTKFRVENDGSGRLVVREEVYHWDGRCSSRWHFGYCSCGIPSCEYGPYGESQQNSSISDEADTDNSSDTANSNTSTSQVPMMGQGPRRRSRFRRPPFWNSTIMVFARHFAKRWHLLRDPSVLGVK